MAAQIPKSVSFGGVNDSAHPLNFPITRSVRCKNWVPKPNGRLQLRYGYTLPTMSTVSAADIHSATYFETWAGTQYILFQQSTALKQLELLGGTVCAIATLTSAAQFGHFRANNKLHLSNATEFKSYDGTTLRNNGIREPQAADFATVSTIGTPGTATDVAGGDTAWASVGNALASDDAYATVSLGSAETSDWIQVSSIGLAIPAGALIVDVRAIVEGNSGSNASSLHAQIIKAGTQQGEISTNVYSESSDTVTTASFTTENGGLSLSPADVNATDFGMAVRMQSDPGTTGTRSIDQITVQVIYTTSVTVSASTATPGSFSTTELTGYQLYLAYYNPNTGHVGNRMAIGTRTTVAGEGYSLVLEGLPDISGIDSEWLKVVGRTPDGGEVPYWFIATNADFATVGR